MPPISAIKVYKQLNFPNFINFLKGEMWLNILESRQHLALLIYTEAYHLKTPPQDKHEPALGWFYSLTRHNNLCILTNLQ